MKQRKRASRSGSQDGAPAELAGHSAVRPVRRRCRPGYTRVTLELPVGLADDLICDARRRRRTIGEIAAPGIQSVLGGYWVPRPRLRSVRAEPEPEAEADGITAEAG